MVIQSIKSAALSEPGRTRGTSVVQYMGSSIGELLKGEDHTRGQLMNFVRKLEQTKAAVSKFVTHFLAIGRLMYKLVA